MPCRDGATFEDELRTSLGAARQRLDDRTDMLCRVMKTLSQDKILLLDKDIQRWWRQHQEEDRRREAEEADRNRVEAARESALKKLTPGERKLLGLEKK